MARACWARRALAVSRQAISTYQPRLTKAWVANKPTPEEAPVISTVPGLLVPGGTGVVKGALCSPEIGGMGEGGGTKKRTVATDLGGARLKGQFPPQSPG